METKTNEERMKEKINVELQIGEVAVLVQSLMVLKQIVDQMTGGDLNSNFIMVNLMVRFNDAAHKAGGSCGKDCSHADNLKNFREAYKKQLSDKSFSHFEDQLADILKPKNKDEKGK